MNAKAILFSMVFALLIGSLGCKGLSMGGEAAPEHENTGEMPEDPTSAPEDHAPEGHHPPGADHSAH